MTDPAHTGHMATAPKAAVFVDVADYFTAAKAAMDKATRSIHFLNWAFEADTRFDPTSTTPDGEIGAYLKAKAAAGIDVRVLVWKAPLFVAAGQGFFTVRDRNAFKGSAVKFALDNRHAFGACHHQKMIVIDDVVAFCGGADIGQDRWDTPEHLDDDPRRLHDGHACNSRHEVMALVDGPAAVALGTVFRKRWRRATGEALPPPAEAAPPIWPQGLAVDLADVPVRISRTFGAWRTYPEVREAGALTLASIAAARHCIYLENQYYTSPVVAEALAARLVEPQGPEVVLISTQHSPSWFDHMTMDRTRIEFIKRLLAADRFGRFHIYSPVTTLGRILIVHAKVAIIDDDFLRVGSANLNNRSTGFDSECDLSFDATSDAHRAFISGLRSRLLAHWLGCPIETFQAAVEREGSFGKAVEVLRATGHCRLRPVPPRRLSPLAQFIAAFHLGDPISPEDSMHLGLRRRRIAAEVAAVADKA